MASQPEGFEKVSAELSKLEYKFARYWQSMDGPDLIIEHQFHPTRKWKFDFAIKREGRLVAFEIEGGIFQRGGGRHNRGKGMENDCEKYMEAALLGWTVIRLTERQINTSVLERLIQFVLQPQTNNAGTH